MALPKVAALARAERAGREAYEALAKLAGRTDLVAIRKRAVEAIGDEKRKKTELQVLGRGMVVSKRGCDGEDVIADRGRRTPTFERVFAGGVMLAA